MAAFIAKQMVGNQLSAVKGAAGGGDGGDGEDDKEKAEEEERERQEAIREAEERRKEKHRRMEEEREKMRQDIRDKYNIKKKEEVVEMAPQEEPNPLMRRKKTPEELAAEAEQEELDDFTIFHLSQAEPSHPKAASQAAKSVCYRLSERQTH
ncbi:complexin isoform X1 [Glossina fuscipes]|uniref:Complexin isoform X1 n=1 Tax=Glossina fuscipes TaxID=7396 RepID=A0A8U0WH69_9MUSC|nr:complexin isoform X1 [Glossina fuscipes]XP_037884855.1 complexin isoform X1 [Glossina fuscipes]XP_037884856.1 complexin isoform X1 [Glossina fuscipes]